MKKITIYFELIDSYLQFFDFSEFKKLKKITSKQEKIKNNPKDIKKRESLELKASIFFPKLKNYEKNFHVRIIFWEKFLIKVLENLNIAKKLSKTENFNILLNIFNKILKRKNFICSGYFRISDIIDIQKDVLSSKIILKEELEIFPKKIYDLNQLSNLYNLLYLRYLKK
jgi:hypothetical protein